MRASVWPNLHDTIEKAHIRVMLANLLKTKAIASMKTKSDKVAARILAHLLRADLIPPSVVPPCEFREKRYLLRHRRPWFKLR